MDSLHRRAFQDCCRTLGGLPPMVFRTGRAILVPLELRSESLTSSERGSGDLTTIRVP